LLWKLLLIDKRSILLTALNMFTLFFTYLEIYSWTVFSF